MKITARGRYAVRIMIDIASNNTGEATKVNQIAKRQDISEKYLEQIISILKKAGFVKSTRGAQGGYWLAKDASFYTVGMILRLTEGNLCLVENDVGECGGCDTCETLDVWKQLNAAVSNVIDGVTIADLAAKQIARTSRNNCGE
ncbi:MAG: Rrf2 family transcriptional regulator [Lachnospiraceae bacterium]|nr:Rrf2 family transcriptional regulator [Lachnospiraceae bacterium]